MSSQKEVPGLQLENINVTRHGHHLDITLVNMTLNQLLLLVNWLELRVFKFEDLCFVLVLFVLIWWYVMILHWHNCNDNAIVSFSYIYIYVYITRMKLRYYPTPCFMQLHESSYNHQGINLIWAKSQSYNYIYLYTKTK